MKKIKIIMMIAALFCTVIPVQAFAETYVDGDTFSKSYTKDCLNKAQRAVAGLAYRYLYNTNRL